MNCRNSQTGNAATPNLPSAVRVLVVEDSPTARALLVHLLEGDSEIQVVGEASDGAQAVEMVEELKPDLITMDVVMPDMDGLETTRRIMARRPTPIVIVTAHAGSPELNVVFEAMKAGAVDVAPKPTGFDQGREQADWGRELLDKIKALASVRPRSVEETGSSGAGMLRGENTDA